MIQKPKLVAPPRGERGLKCVEERAKLMKQAVAPPRGERGLKFSPNSTISASIVVAPPRGERGLKSLFGIVEEVKQMSLPLVGSED